MKIKIIYVASIIILSLLLTSCAEVSPNVKSVITEDCYGFWGGLWHGIIIPFSWVGSVFSEDISIYAYNNNGAWYDFGFVIGLSALGSVINKEPK